MTLLKNAEEGIFQQMVAETIPVREELMGIQRELALGFPNQTSSLQDLNLAQYEVVPVERLYDLKEHINNLLKELPKHLTNEEKVLFEEAVEAVISTKEKLRGSDYCLCCVVLALHLGDNCRLTIRRLLYTLAGLCELLYVPAEKRTPRFILPRPSNPHGLTVRLTVWDANSRSHSFAS